VFKVGLDYWNRFVPDIYTSLQQATISQLTNPLFAGRNPTVSSQHTRLLLYDSTLKGLRKLMVERMVKPEEVLIATDEHGNVVRDFVKDTDVQQQYKTMRETLVYLSHLDHADTEKQMLDKLRMQLNGEEWDWDRLNTLCWVCNLTTVLVCLS
jgi:exportin-1